MKDPIVCIEWTDATGWPGWTEWDELEDLEPKTVKTVGFMLKKSNKDSVWVAMTLSPDVLGDVFCIPRKWIKKITRLD